MTVAGWIGSWCLALCGLPQAVKCIKDKNALGLSWTFLVMWTVGEACTLLFILGQEAELGPLILNYTLNLLFLSIILYFKVKDERKKES